MKWWAFATLPGGVPSTRPLVSPVTEEWYNMLGTLTKGDDTDWIMLTLCASLGDQIYQLVYPGLDVDVNDGWASVFDIDTAPDEFVAYLGQFIGTRLDDADLTGVSLSQQRSLVRAKVGWDRGKPSAIAAAATTYLTGSQRVVVNEIYQGDPYKVSVWTYHSETPDPAKVQAAILKQKPGGMLMYYNVVDGVPWDLLTGTWDAQTDTWDQYSNEVV
jgi:hypothetical protein